jgi:hypothetical protein
MCCVHDRKPLLSIAATLHWQPLSSFLVLINYSAVSSVILIGITLQAAACPAHQRWWLLLRWRCWRCGALRLAQPKWLS